MVKGQPQFDMDEFLAGRMTPVFFGTAIGNFGVREMLDDFGWAPAPQPREAKQREVEAGENKFSGFVFKIQANMIPSIAIALPFCASARVIHKSMKMKHAHRKSGNCRCF